MRVLTGFSPRGPGSNSKYSLFDTFVKGSKTHRQVFSCQYIIPAMLRIHLLVAADIIDPFKAPVSENTLSPNYANRRAYQRHVSDSDLLLHTAH